MNDNRAIDLLRGVKLGIDHARSLGVVCAYPVGAVVEGKWMSWPWKEAADGDLTGRESYQDRPAGRRGTNHAL